MECLYFVNVSGIGTLERQLVGKSTRLRDTPGIIICGPQRGSITAARELWRIMHLAIHCIR